MRNLRKTVIYYVTDEVQQSQYINMFREAGKDAVILKHVIDSQFISHLGGRIRTYSSRELTQILQKSFVRMARQMKQRLKL